MRKKPVKFYSLEHIYERLQEEQENNPAIFCIKQELVSSLSSIFGYNYNAAYRKADELAIEYDLSLCLGKELRGNPAKIINDELGITINNNKKAYHAAIAYIRWRESKGLDYDLKDWYKKYLTKAKK